MPEPSTTRRLPKAPVIIAVVAGIVVCVIAAGTAALLLVLPVREEVTLVEESRVPADAEDPAPTAPLTIEEEAEAVAHGIRAADDAWAAHVTDVEVDTVLRRPVIVVATDIGPEQADTSDEFTAALSSFSGGLTADDGSPFTYYLQVRSSEGDVIGAVKSSDERWALDAPPPPTDTATLQSWLDAAYGAGDSEAWLARIREIDATVGADGTIVVRTDLDPQSLDDQQEAQTIIDAINSSGATFAGGVRVIFGDGAFEWSALLDGVDPYGP